MTPETRELINEGIELEKQLSNGQRGDPGTMSDSIRYLIRTNRIQLNAEFVSDKECLRRMAQCPGAKLSFTWAKACAVIVSMLTVCGTVVGIIVRLL